MIIAHHLILSAYGFWLPNDPRGSWSDFVGAWELFRAGGPATTVSDRRSYAHDPHDRQRRLETKRHLKFPAVRFTGVQVDAIARGIEMALAEGGYACHACAVLADHAHLVIAQVDRNITQVIGHLKAKAAMQLASSGCHPFQEIILPDGRRPSPWGERGWKVFIDDVAHLAAAVAYVEANPVKEGRAVQRWGFVTAARLGPQAGRLNGDGDSAGRSHLAGSLASRGTPSARHPRGK